MLVKRMPFCPIPHTFRDQFWLSVGLGLGLGLARYLRGLGRCSLSLRSGTTLYYWPATGKAETIRLLLAEGGVPFEESNFEKPDGAPVYAAGGEGMTARTSAAAAAFFTACRSRAARRARTREGKVTRVDHVLPARSVVVTD